MDVFFLITKTITIMSKKVLSAIGILALIASLAMYMVGKNSANLSELKDYWWAPLPVALICFLVASKK
jgi:hypothetical protein